MLEAGETREAAVNIFVMGLWWMDESLCDLSDVRCLRPLVDALVKDLEELTLRLFVLPPVMLTQSHENNTITFFSCSGLQHLQE